MVYMQQAYVYVSLIRGDNKYEKQNKWQKGILQARPGIIRFPGLPGTGFAFIPFIRTGLFCLCKDKGKPGKDIKEQGDRQDLYTGHRPFLLYNL